MQHQSKLNRNRSWLKEEDDKLLRQINATGTQINWKTVSVKSGLKRSANSCRLRWINHLTLVSRPGKLTDEEKLLILEFRSRWGGRNWWTKIAKHLLPGRRDNDVKNFWHTLAKRAEREERDVDSDAVLKKVELVETIKAAGKLTMDYSSSISPMAYNLLKELLPDVPGAVSLADDYGSDLGRNWSDLASSSETEFGSGRVGSEFSNTVMAQQEQFVEARQYHVPVEQQQQIDYGGDLVGFNPVESDSASTGTHNPYSGPSHYFFNQVPDNYTCIQTSNHIQDVASSGSASTGNIFVDAPQVHEPIEQQQQLGFNSWSFDHGHGRGPTTFKWGSANSNGTGNGSYYAEEEVRDALKNTDYLYYAHILS